MFLMALIVIDLVGLAGMTWLFPVLGGLIRSSSKERRSPTSAADKCEEIELKTVAIIIPAHNEESTLPESLRSISAAIKQATEVWAVNISVYVAADACTDNTAAVARSFGADVLEYSERKGKWRSLQMLVANSIKCDWFIIVDAGTLWRKNFLLEVLPHCIRNEVMAIAPTYSNNGGGRVEKLLWWFERQLKTLESKCGGPVSVHGATICYRARELIPALQYLARRDWLNDDVVLPLSLRAHFPHKRILYLPGLCVAEQLRTAPPSPEYARRRRMTVGNIEWITHLWLPLWRQNALAALLATRRVFRLFWAYWILLSLAIGVWIVGISLPSTQNSGAIYLSLMISLLALAAIRYAASLRPITRGALASLVAPFLLLTPHVWPSQATEEVPWR